MSEITDNEPFPPCLLYIIGHLHFNNLFNGLDHKFECKGNIRLGYEVVINS